MSIIKLADSSTKALGEFLKMFCDKYKNQFTFAELEEFAGQAKDKIWTKFYYVLRHEEDVSVLERCLYCCRILSRDKTMIDKSEAVDDSFIDAVLKHAELKNGVGVLRESLVVEALMCLCNMVFNSKKVQLICANNGVLERIVSRMRTYTDPKFPHPVKMYDTRLLFLITALVPKTRSYLTDELHALTYLMEIIDYMLKNSGTHYHHSRGVLDRKDLELAVEILKVIYNLTMKESTGAVYEEDNDHESTLRLVTILRELLLCDGPQTTYSPLFSQVINVLTNMPVSSLHILMPEEGAGYEHGAVECVLTFLMVKLKETPESNLFEVLSPTFTLLIRLARHHKVIRRYIRCEILPPLKLEDMKRRPEEQTTLRGRLCKLLTSVNDPIRDMAAELLFILCRENVDRLIKYAGFGNAAGLLAQRGLLGASGSDQRSTNYSSEDEEDGDTDEYKQNKDNINPVTGVLEFPKPKAIDSMTEEQKEYEAMQLVNAIDKLNRQGLIQPCRIGEDGRPHPIDNVLQLQEELEKQNLNN